ncbi:MAG: GNAT family N-acetyltransferase, partial [Eubacteriales bacterium]
MNFEITDLHVHRELINDAALWFNEKWSIPTSAYLESMSGMSDSPVPRWYIVLDEDRENKIIAGLGVIENDFHNRPDLTPNVCAVYVEEEYRNRGIAGKLLGHVCSDMAKNGISTLYLVTDHTSFYERYGWEYFCP